MGDIPGNPERRLPQGSPPPFAQNRSNMAIFKVEGGRRLRGEITPQGAKNEALQILCATLLTQEKVIVHNVPQILDVIQLIELLQAMGVEVERLSEESYSFRAADIDPDYLRSDDYCRRGQPPQGFGDAAGSDAGAFRRGLHAQAGRRQDRPPQARHPLHRLSEAGRHARFRHCGRLLRSPTARNSRGATCCSTRLR